MSASTSLARAVAAERAKNETRESLVIFFMTSPLSLRRVRFEARIFVLRETIRVRARHCLRASEAAPELVEDRVGLAVRGLDHVAVREAAGLTAGRRRLGGRGGLRRFHRRSAALLRLLDLRLLGLARLERPAVVHAEPLGPSIPRNKVIKTAAMTATSVRSLTRGSGRILVVVPRRPPVSSRTRSLTRRARRGSGLPMAMLSSPQPGQAKIPSSFSSAVITRPQF